MLNYLTGALKIQDISYQNSKNAYYFEDFDIISSFDQDRVRTITMNSPDIMSGQIIGKYKVKEVQKIESNETITDKSKIETNVKVIDCTDISEQIIEPIDNTKEIVINGKV